MLTRYILWTAILTFPIFSFGQTSFQFDTNFANISFKDFFLKNSNISSLETSGYNLRWLTIVLKSNDTDSTTKSKSPAERINYDLKFEGDRYFLQKRYGSFQLPSFKIPDFLKRPDIIEWHASYKINVDSVHCEIWYYVRPPVTNEDDYDIVFTKVESQVSYKPGISALHQCLEIAWKNQSACEQISIKDSAAILILTLSNKGCVKEVMIKEGPNFPYLQSIAAMLMNDCSWIPFEAGGRPVTYRFPIFVHIKPDLSITIAIPE